MTAIQLGIILLLAPVGLWDIWETLQVFNDVYSNAYEVLVVRAMFTLPSGIPLFLVSYFSYAKSSYWERGISIAGIAVATAQLGLAVIDFALVLIRQSM